MKSLAEWLATGIQNNVSNLLAPPGKRREEWQKCKKQDPFAREMGNVAVGQGMRTLCMVALGRVKGGMSRIEQVLVLTAAH